VTAREEYQPGCVDFIRDYFELRLSVFSEKEIHPLYSIFQNYGNISTMLYSVKG